MIHGRSILSSHGRQLIDLNRLAISENEQDDRKADRRLCSRYRDYEEDHNLTFQILQDARESNKSKIHGIQHQLDAHKNDEQVAPDENTKHSDEEQDQAEHD